MIWLYMVTARSAVHGNSEVSSGKWNIRKTRIQSSDAVNDSLRTPLRKRKNISPETLQRVSKRRNLGNASGVSQDK